MVKNFVCNYVDVRFVELGILNQFFFQVKFDQFVEQGRVLHNYASILELLLRLRQCCDHPFLVMRFNLYPTNVFHVLYFVCILHIFFLAYYWCLLGRCLMGERWLVDLWHHLDL